MFEKIQYKLLISRYMTKEEYKQLIQKYMDDYNISYISSVQKVENKQKQRFKNDYDIEYEKLLLDTYNDIIENGYNISML